MKYQKVVREFNEYPHVFYIRLDIKLQGNEGVLNLLQISDFVIRDNEFIKNRYADLENTLDKFLTQE